MRFVHAVPELLATLRAASSFFRLRRRSARPIASQAPKLQGARLCGSRGVGSSVAVLAQQIFAYESLAKKTGGLGSAYPIAQEGRFSETRHACVVPELLAFEFARFGSAMAIKHMRRAGGSDEKSRQIIVKPRFDSLFFGTYSPEI